MGSTYPHVDNFEGEGPSHSKVGHSAVICAKKTAEPIEMPFGLKTWVGPGKHVFDGARIRHVKGQLLEERTCLGMRRHFAISCAETVSYTHLTLPTIYSV